MRFALAALMLPLPGCLASKIVATPAGLAVDAAQATGKGVMLAGGAALRVTGDALDGPDEMIRLTVTCTKGKGTRTEERTVKAKHLEREVRDMSKDGKVLDVEVAPLD